MGRREYLAIGFIKCISLNSFDIPILYHCKNDEESVIKFTDGSAQNWHKKKRI
jgi:hypothetical protein